MFAQLSGVRGPVTAFRGSVATRSVRHRLTRFRVGDYAPAWLALMDSLMATSRSGIDGATFCEASDLYRHLHLIVGVRPTNLLTAQFDYGNRFDRAVDDSGRSRREVPSRGCRLRRVFAGSSLAVVSRDCLKTDFQYLHPPYEQLSGIRSWKNAPAWSW